MNREESPALSPSGSPIETDSTARTSGLRTDTLADSVMLLLAMTVVQRLAGFCRAILFCRWLTPEELGQWDMAFGFLMLATPLAVLALPGTFGRYVERYRQRGQLHTFLKRTAAFCGVLALVVVMLICLARHWFSQLIFGTPTQTEVVLLLAAALAAMVIYSYLIELFTALRNMRLVSLMRLGNSVIFAVLGIGLLLGWQCTAGSVVLAYGGACLACAAGAGYWLARTWNALPDRGSPRLSGGLWSKLVPFALWMLAVNLLSNLFTVTDRYMIIHYSNASPGEALATVGDYHSSRVVPVLLVSIAAMMATMITPHLSHDWEAGRRERVSAQLNLFLKLLTFALMVGAVAVLFAAPLLFGVALQGKFSGGEAVLPWTLTYCVWFGVALVAQNYLWCVEKAYLASLALAIGLAVNVALNLVLLPRLGLLGAVLATTAANLVALLLIFWFGRLAGFHLDRGLWALLGAPPAVCLGPWIAALVLLAIALEAIGSERLLSGEEKAELIAGLRRYSAGLRKTTHLFTRLKAGNA